MRGTPNVVMKTLQENGLGLDGQNMIVFKEGKNHLNGKSRLAHEQNQYFLKSQSSQFLMNLIR